jgi:hypothetical protein
VATITEWIAFCERLRGLGVEILRTADIPFGPRGPSDIRVLACTLLGRTVGHVKSIELLAKAKMVVEARVLVILPH